MSNGLGQAQIIFFEKTAEFFNFVFVFKLAYSFPDGKSFRATFSFMRLRVLRYDFNAL